MELASVLYKMFTDKGIKVIRLGLHSIENDAYMAGPWHPSFSELCQSKIMLNSALEKLCEKGNYTLFVGKSDVSKMVGQKKSNILYLEEKGFNCKVRVDENLKDLNLIIEREV